MSAGRRLALVHQAMVVWAFIDDKTDLAEELTQFVETGSVGVGAVEPMPYNEDVIKQIVANGLWDR